MDICFVVLEKLYPRITVAFGIILDTMHVDGYVFMLILPRCVQCSADMFRNTEACPSCLQWHPWRDWCLPKGRPLYKAFPLTREQLESRHNIEKIGKLKEVANNTADFNDT